MAVLRSPTMTMKQPAGLSRNIMTNTSSRSEPPFECSWLSVVLVTTIAVTSTVAEAIVEVEAIGTVATLVKVPVQTAVDGAVPAEARQTTDEVAVEDTKAVVVVVVVITIVVIAIVVAHRIEAAEMVNTAVPAVAMVAHPTTHHIKQ